MTSVSDTFQPGHVCNTCSRFCLSKAELNCYIRSHGCIQLQADFTQVLLQQPTENSCQFCDKVYGSTANLRSYGVNVSAKDSPFLVTYVTGLARVKLAQGVTCTLTGGFCRIEEMSFCI